MDDKDESARAPSIDLEVQERAMYISPVQNNGKKRGNTAGDISICRWVQIPPPAPFQYPDRIKETI